MSYTTRVCMSYECKRSHWFSLSSSAQKKTYRVKSLRSVHLRWAKSAQPSSLSLFLSALSLCLHPLILDVDFVEEGRSSLDCNDIQSVSTCSVSSRLSLERLAVFSSRHPFVNQVLYSTLPSFSSLHLRFLFFSSSFSSLLLFLFLLLLLLTSHVGEFLIVHCCGDATESSHVFV